MEDISREIASLMKQGRGSELRSYLEKRKANQVERPETFSQYMTRIISGTKRSRKDIAQAAGLDRQYCYKILNGSKKTTERDYIIAICYALKMTVSQMQYALSLYPFPPLVKESIRDATIIAALENNENILTLDTWLESANCLPLKTSPEMKSAEIKVGLEPFKDQQKTSNYGNILDLYSVVSKNAETFCPENGITDFDRIMRGEIEIKSKENEKLYIYGEWWPNGTNQFFAVSKHSMYRTLPEDFDSKDFVETYLNFSDTHQSDFFIFFMQLDYLTNDTYAKDLEKVNDTANCSENTLPGMRWPGRAGGHLGECSFIEVYNSTEPEKQEYLQVIQYPDHVRYTASHQSMYMQMECPEGFYELIFGPLKEELFFQHYESTEDLLENCHDPFYRYYLQAIRLVLEFQDSTMGIGEKRTEDWLYNKIKALIPKEN